MNRILHICINNDTLCLSKSNIVDYSLLTIIDKERKKIRFGIIDYVQQYTIDKIFESKFKNFISGGEIPTITDPEKYKMRFKRAMKRYFVGIGIQDEKRVHSSTRKHLDYNGTMIDDNSQGEDGDDDNVNETRVYPVNENRNGTGTVENSIIHIQNNSSNIKIIDEED
jgi:hypothetical protein